MNWPRLYDGNFHRIGLGIKKNERYKRRKKME